MNLMSIRRGLPMLAIAATGPLAAQVSTGCVNELSGQECDQQLNTITTAVPFLMISPDSRAGGMGDAGVAVSADANALHWNPSKLVFAEDESEFRMSYSPWLRNLVPDMSLAYLAAYKRLANGRSAVGGSLRYFNLGSIQFTDVNGQPIRDFKPAEFAVDITLSQKLSDKTAGGISLRYINSNLTGGLNVSGANTKAGQSIAADLSFYYIKDDFRFGEKDGEFAFGVNVSNIGAKMSYSDAAKEDFIPINLRLGPRFTIDLDDYNSLTWNLDINKLLVPTPPVYLIDSAGSVVTDDQGNLVIASGKDPNRGVAAGMFGSFTDAPGVVFYDEAGNPQVESGSIAREEFREINFGTGFEYWYAKQFAFRGGYFWEHYTKGNRKYVTLGAGLRYKVFSLDLSYLIANTQRSPLANTLRFTLGFNFDGKKKKAEGVE